MIHFHDSTATPLVQTACNEAVGMIHKLRAESQGRGCCIDLNAVALWSAQCAAPKMMHFQHKDLAEQVLEKIRGLLTQDCQGRA